MKITKAPKRLAEANDAVKTLLLQIAAASDDELPPILDGISEWCWPRGDLHYWTATLNRFDDILAETCADYDLANLQINDFTPNRKRLLLSVLRFSRLLLENCTNRKLYNSFEHLNVLLATQDVDVFEATLRLILRPAQQYSSQGGGRRADFAISPERLNALAIPWAPREHAIDMVEWVRDDATLPTELSHVKFHFYRHRSFKEAAKEEHQVAGPSTAVTPVIPSTASSQRAIRTPARQQPTASVSAGSGLSFVPAPVFPPTTPTPVSRARAQSPPPHGGNSQPSHDPPRDAQNEGLVSVDLGFLTHTLRRPVDILADAVEKYHIPSEDHFELFQKIRLAMSVKDVAKRRQLLVCRLLAIAIYAHTTSESTASTQLFLYEPDLVQRLARVVDPSSRVGTVIQSGAFYALDALGRYRGKVNDVLTAVNASANHGILLHVLRDLVDILSAGDAAEGQPDDRLIDSLFGFISFVTSTVVGSNMVVSAGLLPLLIRIVEKTNTQAYMLQRTVTRAVGLIDSVLYAYQPSFGLFCSARGLDVFVARIESEISIDVNEYADGKLPQDKSTGADHPDNLYGRLSFGRAQLLRHLCKSISHMMSTTGTAEGLRNLIDSSLLGSVKRIFQNRRVFGGQILALSIHIMATFIHNEPTSLGIVQEKQLPQAFLDLVEEDIEANYDVIAAIPNAIGALCLNQAGVDLLNSRPLVPKLFALFTSTRYTKVLADRDNASLFGSSIDELVRHQPSVKQSVIECAVQCLKDIEAAGQSLDIADDEKKNYLLLQVPPQEQNDVEMSEAAGAAQGIAQDGSAPGQTQVSEAPADDAEIVLEEPELFPLRPKPSHTAREGSGRENAVIGYMEVISRFLDGLFQTTGHCKDFLKQDGLLRLLALYRLPCLPYDFVNSVANDSVVTLIRFIVEISPHTVLNAVLEHAKTCLLEATEARLLQTEPSDGGTGSALLGLAKPSDEESLKMVNAQFRLLVNLNAATHLLADIAPTFGYSGAKLPTTFLTTVNSASSLLATKAISMEELGDLQRKAIWENVRLKAATAGVTSANVTAATAHAQGKRSPDAGSGTEQPSDDVSMITGSDEPAPALPGPSTPTTAPKSSLDRQPYRSNVVALRHLASSLPSSIVTFFLETSCLLTERRSSDSNHRKQAHTTSLALAKVLAKCLTWQDSPRAEDSLTFAATMTGFASSLLYDDKPHGSGVFAQTLTLSAFVRDGGLQTVVQNFDLYVSEISRHFDSAGQRLHGDQAPDRARLGHACGGLRVSLALLPRMVSSKAVEDSPATAMMSSRGGTRPVVENFDAADLVVRIRSEVLPLLQQTWQQSWLPQMPLGIIRALISTLTPILEAQGEVAQKPEATTNATSAGRTSGRDSNAASSAVLGGLHRSMNSMESALAGLSGMLGAHGSGAPSAHRSRLAVQPGESQTTQLMEMGFPRAAARAALSRCANNLTLATDYLLTHPEIVANPGPDIEPPPEETNASEATGESAGDSAGPAVTAPSTAAVSDANEMPAVVNPDVRMGEGESGPEAGPTNHGTEESREAVSSLLDALNAAEPATEETSTKNDSATTTKVDGEAVEAAKARKVALDSSRESFYGGLMPRVLSLADQHGSLVFEAKSLFKLLAKDDVQKQAALDAILEDLHQDRLNAMRRNIGQDATERRLAGRLRLTAILLTDSATAPLLGTATLAIVVAAAAELVARPQETDAPPPWRTSLLLSAAAALSGETQVSKTDVTSEQDPEKLSAAPRLPVLDARQFDKEACHLYDYCLTCLAAPSTMSREELLAVYRLLTVLTRRPELSQRLATDGRLADVLKPFKSVSPWTIAGCQVFAVLVLRQVAESVSLLRALLEHEIRVAFDAARNRTMDTNSLARHLSSAMLRDPELFVELAAENMDMIDYIPAKAQGIVRLRQDAKLGTKKTVHATSPSEDPNAGKQTASESASQERLQTVMDLLVSEALSMSSKVKETLASSTASHGGASAGVLPHAAHAEDGTLKQTPSSASDTARVDTTTGDDDADKVYFYTCFLLQCLTELLSSYVPAKRYLLETNKGLAAQTGPVSAEDGHFSQQPSHGLGLVECLLADLAPIGFVQPGDHSHMRRSMSVSNWAMSLLVAATADVKHHSGITEVSPVLVDVRRFILDAIAKAIRDVGSFNEVVEIRYGRLYALADLCYRLLTARPNHTHPASSGGSARPSEDITLHIAKTMLEKNFVSVLTTALSEVDLDLPMVKPLLDRILKPLEHLTKAAIKMGKSTRKATATDSRGDSELGGARGAGAATGAHAGSGVDAMEVDSESDDENDGHTEGDSEHEDTPDLYRNSALGIHQSENFTEHRGDSEEENDSEDEEMEQMEYESDIDDSDRSDSSSDEEGDETMEGVMEIDAYDSDEESGSDDEDSDNDDEDAEMEDLSDGEGHEWVTDDEEEQDDPAVYDEHPLDFVMNTGANDEDADGRPEDFFAMEGAFIAGAHDSAHLADGVGDDGMDDMEEEDDIDEEADDVSVDSYEQDDLAQLEFMGGPLAAGAPQDRFGANWGWTHMASLPRAAGGTRAPSLPIPSFLNPLNAESTGASTGRRRHTRLLDLEAPLPPHVHRSAGQQSGSESITSHPLLVDQEGPSASTRPSVSRERTLGPQHRGYNDWAQSLEELMAGGGGTMDLISSLLTRSGVMPTDGLRVTLSQNADGQPVVSMEGGAAGDGPHALTGHGHLRALPRHNDTSHSQRRTQQRTDLVNLVQEFLPVPTSTRWSEAARLMYTSVSESAERLVTHVANILQLPYRRSQRELQRKKETQRQLESKLSDFKREKERLAAQLDEARVREEAARTNAAQEAQPPSASDPSVAHQSAVETSGQEVTHDAETEDQLRTAEAIALSQEGQTSSEDVEMEAAGDSARHRDTLRSRDSSPSTASHRADMELESLQRSLGELERPGALNSTEQSGQLASTQTAASRPGATSDDSASDQITQHQPRLTTTIRGRTVDITDSGIDPTFLEALPDDMREEVVNQHFRERRAASSLPALADSSIAPEFLDALPPEIRAEVMRAEAAEAQQSQRSERNETSGRGESSTSTINRDDDHSDDVDPSSFIATLDPGLREAVLAQRDNSVFDRLPAGVAAELDHLRRERQNQHEDGQTSSNTIMQRGDALPSTSVGASVSTRDAIQVLDKSGVATLVRLLFFPQMSSRSTVLHKVLANVQENARTREELLNLLLMILADGITDTQAVDKSYASMSARAARAGHVATNTPARPTPKRHSTAPSGNATTPSQPPSHPSQLPTAPISRTGEEAPFLIASRSIDTLLHLTHSSEQTAWYFLREDVRGPRKLAKGKERADTSQQSKEPRAPINILLGLLNKQAILGNPQLVDSLVALLSSVTKPLTTLTRAQAKEHGKGDVETTKEAHNAASMPNAVAANSSTPQPPSTAADAAPHANSGTLGTTSAQPSADSAPITTMPEIPPERISAIVKPLGTAISARGFQHTLSIASNLTAVPGGRDVIISSLRQEAEGAGKAMVKDLDSLLDSLPVPLKASEDEESTDTDQGRVQSPALSGLADGANAQAVLLRSLRAIEWLAHHEATAPV